MPGIQQLSDRDFIRAFQRIDGVIQNNQPVFVAVWLGSVVALLAAVGLGIEQVEGVQFWLLIATPIVYLVGVQLSTFTINVPLNNQLQALNLEAMDAIALQTARRNFEPRWNFWNLIRAPFASLTAILLIVLLDQL